MCIRKEISYPKHLEKKCLRLGRWDRHPCTEERMEPNSQKFSEFLLCGLPKKWAHIQRGITNRAHTRLFTTKQGAKTLQEQTQHCMHRKEMQMQLRLRIFHKGVGDPSCRSMQLCIPFEKNDYTSCWARCSKWKNCCYLHHIEHSFRNSESTFWKFNTSGTSITCFIKCCPLSTWIWSYCS